MSSDAWKTTTKKNIEKPNGLNIVSFDQKKEEKDSRLKNKKWMFHNKKPYHH